MSRPKPVLCRAKVIRQTETERGFFHLVCSVPNDFPDPQPGQFVHLRLSEGSDPLLPRAYGIVGFSRGPLESTFELYYGVVGAASKLLAAMPVGREIPCLGPLGRGYWINPERAPILVAGGRGVAPLLMVYAALKPRLGRLPFVYGFRTRSLGYGIERISESDRCIATDDGTLGIRGTAIDALASLPEDLLRSSSLYACGPEVMLKRAALFALEREIPCQVSMEATFACGVGICRGCPIPKARSDSYLMCCSDGPVFEAREVRWERIE